LFIVFITIWGGAILLLLFKLKWFLIIAYIALYFSFRKAFHVEINLYENKIILNKKFLGLNYHRTKQTFTNVLFFAKPEGIKFYNKNDALFICLEMEGISIKTSKREYLICTKKEAEELMPKLKIVLAKMNINNNIQII
jgi:hypothetical protein